jgi:ABC-type sugar transport system ATPase subunit
MTDVAASRPVLDAQGIAKRFGAVTALKNASLTISAGEVVALMGANGAGKSTFVKILTGALRHDTGTIHLDGNARPVLVARPGAAWPVSCRSTRNPR